MKANILIEVGLNIGNGLDMPVLVSTVLDEADLTTVLLDNHLAVSTEGLESICLQSLDGFKVPTFSVLL
jgi:hypothetical protein